MKDLKKRAVLGGLAKLCGQSATLVLRLSFIVIMARLLDPAQFGLVAMTAVMTGILDIFTTAGLSSATIQRASVTDEQISTLFWINVLVGTVLCLICLAIAPALVSFYHEPRLFGITVTLGAGFIFGASGVQHSALLQRQLRYVTLALIETFALASGFALGIVLAIRGFGYWALVYSTIATPAITTVLLWLTVRWIPGLPRRGVGVRPMLHFGGTISLNILVVYIAYNLDKLLLGRVWGADILGLYGRAYQLINVPTSNLNNAVGGVVFSALSRLQDDPIRLRSYFLKGYSLVTSMTLPVSVFGALFADDIVPVVLGPKWTDAATTFRLLTPTILVFGIINPTGWLLQSIGLQKRSLAIALVIAPLVIIGYLIGLPYGANGVALGFSAAMMLWLVPHVIWALHGTIISPQDVAVATSRPFFASIIAGSVAFAVHAYIGNTGSHLLRLLLAGGVMTSLYAVIFLFVMGQRTFYLELFKGLRGSQYSTQDPS
jgi:O-antigen/teichoic acid export membrane protein